MTPQQIDAMKLALEALEGFYEYGYDRQECFEHITAIKEALAEHAMQEVQRLGQEIEQKIGCVNHDCEQCKAQRTEQEPLFKKIIDQHPGLAEELKALDGQEPLAWPCLIDSADFSENTITLVMQCEDYKVSAGTHWLSTTPPKETK